MKKLLYIIGPTASGKTDVALTIAARFSGEIIAADSRQVYTGMTIGSGKDIPPGSKKCMSGMKVAGQKIFYYKTPDTHIWGFDLVSPKDDFSVAIYKYFVDQVIADIHKRGKIPIIVGGTGFYIESIETPPASIFVPINPTLREKLATFTVKELQGYLNKQSPEALAALNSSDRQNPRRLIRKIEIVSYGKNHDNETKVSENQSYDSLWIGLDAPMEVLEQRIEKRVAERLETGFELECQNLSDKGMLKESLKSASATGYRQWLEYKSGKISREEFVKKWVIAEKQYVRRQKTWFKKITQCRWFESGSPQTLSSVVQMIENW